MAKIKIFLIQFLFLFLLSSNLFAKNKIPNVVLITVADSADIFWKNIHKLANEAAKDLGVNFKIKYSNRNHILAVKMAEEISKQKIKPDYVIVVGEKLIASQSIPVLCNAGIKVMMYGSLLEKELKVIGLPREKYPNYLGKISINDYMAGYLTADIIFKEVTKNKLYDTDGFIKILAFEGVRKTSFSSERVRGLNDALKKYPKIKLLQSISTDWSYDYAFKTLPRLLARYKKDKISAIWCANTNLARASVDILKTRGRKPGIDCFISGTDWDIESVEYVKNGKLVGIAGGHVAIISWLVTLIYDYHNGIDFDSSVYLNETTIMNKKLSEKFLANFSQNNWDFIDYNNFSKAKNKKLTKHKLNFKAILNSLK